MELGITLDPKGLRSRNHIITMLKYYNQAKDLADQTGAGEIEEEQITNKEKSSDEVEHLSAAKMEVSFL